MKNGDIGIIQQVELKKCFKREDKDFTPWINQNISLIGNKLGIDITDNSIEKSVGKFRCDIIARESESSRTIIIENQFGLTDHDHLGKIFTYAAGLGASIIIWIAEKFREEHEKVLNWLNENLDPNSDLSFFGIELRMIIIDNSNPAPDFRVLVKPNDWSRVIRRLSGQLSNKNKFYIEIFSQIVDTFYQLNPDWRKIKPQPQSWLAFGAGKSGLLFMWAFRGGNRFSVELYIDTGDLQQNLDIFSQLETFKEKFESHLPQLSWERIEGKRVSRIAIYYQLEKQADELDENGLEKLVTWATTTMKDFREAFAPYIKSL